MLQHRHSIKFLTSKLGRPFCHYKNFTLLSDLHLCYGGFNSLFFDHMLGRGGIMGILVYYYLLLYSYYKLIIEKAYFSIH